MATELLDPPAQPPEATAPLPAPLAPDSAAAASPVPPARDRRATWIFALALAGLLAGGIFLRVYPSAAFDGVGFDEHLYRIYVGQLGLVGLLGYPDITEAYIEKQASLPSAILPPTRFLYIYCAHLWRGVFGGGPLPALHAVSCLFSVLMLGLAALWSWRLGGRAVCLGVTALMACAPTEIHMSQHALIDGFFAFWASLALWALWESLRNPERLGWQLLYAGALALMVLTKENAFFIYLALLGLLGLNLKLRFGTVTSRLLLLSFAGPLLGLVVLLFLAGGVENFVGVYRLLVAKAYTLEYAIKTGDGPWHRYLVDLLLSSPLTLLLAVGAAFRVRFKDKSALYFLGFIALTYALMCSVKYGMNLRYATVWNLPLRYLAFAQLLVWARFGGARAPLFLAVGVGALCAYDLRQYTVFFVQNDLYELVSEGLLRALKILK